MVRGFYAAGSGMLANSRKLDIAAGNIANSRTSGYKRDKAVSSAFQERLVLKMDSAAPSETQQIGSVSQGQTIGSVYTSFEQGAIVETGNIFDLAISGEGFFSVLSADNTVLYTRNGEFCLDRNGYIADSAGGLLLGQNGPINTRGMAFDVSPDGVVSVDGTPVDRLAIYCPENNDALVRRDRGFAATAAAGQRPFTGSVFQGCIEASNADMLDEMMAIIQSQRSFQSCSQAVRMIDATLQKAVELSRMNV